MKRHRVGTALGAAWLASASLVPLVQAQPDSVGPDHTKPVTTDREAPEELAHALDEALAALRIAEARGEGAKEAFERAGARVRFVLERDPGNLRAKYYQGRMLLLSDRKPEALDSLVQWTKSREGQNDSEAHNILGRVYYDIQFYKMAKPILEKAIELDPRSPDSYILLARCEAKLLHRKEALDRIQEGIQLLGADADADTYMLLTDVLLLNQQTEPAERAARYAKELARAKVRESGGDVAGLKKVDTCIALVLKVVKMKVNADRTDVRACMEMSDLLLEQSQVTALTGNMAALGWLQEGLRRAGDRPPATLLLSGSRLLMRLGRVEQAVQWADVAVRLYPDNSEVTEFRATLPSAKAASEPEATPPSADSRGP